MKKGGGKIKNESTVMTSRASVKNEKEIGGRVRRCIARDTAHLKTEYARQEEELKGVVSCIMEKSFIWEGVERVG